MLFFQFPESRACFLLQVLGLAVEIYQPGFQCFIFCFQRPILFLEILLQPLQSSLPGIEFFLLDDVLLVGFPEPVLDACYLGLFFHHASERPTQLVVLTDQAHEFLFCLVVVGKKVLVGTFQFFLVLFECLNRFLDLLFRDELPGLDISIGLFHLLFQFCYLLLVRGELDFEFLYFLPFRNDSHLLCQQLLLLLLDLLLLLLDLLMVGLDGLFPVLQFVLSLPDGLFDLFDLYVLFDVLAVPPYP